VGTRAEAAGSQGSPVTAGELARITGAELRGRAEETVTHVAPLDGAGEGALAFVADASHARRLPTTRASVVILTPAHAALCTRTMLVTERPQLAYARAAARLRPDTPPPPGVHPTAIVHPTARVAPSATIGPYCVLEEESVVEDHAVLGPRCRLGARSRVGAATRLVASVDVGADGAIGRRVVVHPGAVLGADGFGYAHDGERWHRIPQLGGVRIGDDVDIGANTCIDRGAIEDTVIEDGVKLDNLIQIGHNVRVGAHTIMAAMVGVAGSTVVGRHCQIGGMCAITGHVRIADGTILAGHSSVTGSIPRPGVYASVLPAVEVRRWRRLVALFHRLDRRRPASPQDPGD
jgi:UDP-3-O-[3-hydroxymyristoyl] glucosamine N-acyltransferase